VPGAPPVKKSRTDFFTTLLDGGALVINGISPVRVAGNLFLRQTATVYGGAVYITYGAAPDISGNTFLLNVAGYIGGAIWYAWDTFLSIRQNIIMDNTALKGGGIASGLALVPFSLQDARDRRVDGATVSCNDVYNNTPTNYYSIPDQTGLNGNVSTDPLFCDTRAAYEIDRTSPAAPMNSPGCDLIEAYGICDSMYNKLWITPLGNSVVATNHHLALPCPQPIRTGIR
jgi:hypothetical protein